MIKLFEVSLVDGKNVYVNPAMISTVAVGEEGVAVFMADEKVYVMAPEAFMMMANSAAIEVHSYNREVAEEVKEVEGEVI